MSETFSPGGSGEEIVPDTSSKFLAPFPASQCSSWIVVLIIECLAVVVLKINFITIIAFVKQRQLQRRGLYLIIYLEMYLLVGAVSGPLQIERIGGDFCELSK